MRRGFKARIDTNVTSESSKGGDEKLLKEFACTSEYKADEFNYVKKKLEYKYGFKFKDYYKRSQTIEEWDKIKDTLSVINNPAPSSKKLAPKKSPKPKEMEVEDWKNASIEELSPLQALERFNRLKAEERRQRLLEEVRNIELLI